MNIMWTADIRMKWRCDHRCCDCDLSNRKVSPKNVFGAATGFEPMAFALGLQCSTNWAMKTHTLGADQFIEFIVPVKGMKHMNINVNCGHTNEMEMWSSQLWLRFKQSQSKPEKCFRAFNGIRTHAHCSANAEAMGSNPVEAPKTFFGLTLRLLKSQSQLRWSHLHFIPYNVPLYRYLFISLIVSGRYPENPAIWLVPGAGSIFLSPDHGRGNQLR